MAPFRARHVGKPAKTGYSGGSTPLVPTLLILISCGMLAAAHSAAVHVFAAHGAHVFSQVWLLWHRPPCPPRLELISLDSPKLSWTKLESGVQPKASGGAPASESMRRRLAAGS